MILTLLISLQGMIILDCTSLLRSETRLMQSRRVDGARIPSLDGARITTTVLFHCFFPRAQCWTAECGAVTLRRFLRRLDAVIGSGGVAAEGTRAKELG